ncbi:MAG: NAD(P)H-dependent oxidoreductase subunit E [Chloroflexi bacterium]|nr:NAD(P)H-dependent oxidoreductase subunit E [Chloroflexota bacterium]
MVQEKLDDLLKEYRGKRGVLLEVFHRVQEIQGYISPQAVEAIATALGMSPAHVYGALTFYSELRTTPPPERSIGLCGGPACYLRGAEKVRQAIEGHIGVAMGQASPDNKTEVKWVQCPGICHVAPFLTVDGKIHGKVTPEVVPQILGEGKER